MNISNSNKHNRIFSVFFDIAFAMLLTAGMRLYGIQHESVWLDEYFSANYLNQPTLYSFLHEQRHENWEMAPFYYIVQYAWSNGFPGSMVWVRLLSVFCSLGSVVLLYIMGRRFFSRSAGLVASILYAFSPFQIFHGQEIRPYSLITFLSLLSFACFLEWHQREKRLFFTANVFANTLLLWTHLLSPLIFLTQGVFLISTRLFRIRMLSVWIVTHVVLMSSILLVVFGINKAPDPEVPKPFFGSIWHFISDNTVQNDGSFVHKAFLNEGEYIRWTIGFPPKYGGVSLPEVVHSLILIHHPVEIALGRLFLLGIGIILVTLLFKIKVGCVLNQLRLNGFPAIFYIFLCFIIPLFILFLLSQFWKPHIFQSRYVIYCWPFLYLLFGISADYLRSRLVRYSYVILSVIMMFSLGLAGILLPIRIDYLGVSSYISSDLSPQSELLFDDYNTQRLVLFNMGGADVTADYYHEPERLISHLDTVIKQGKDGWVVCYGDGSSKRRNQLTIYGFNNDIPFICRTFLGMQNLYVYHFPSRNHDN